VSAYTVTWIVRRGVFGAAVLAAVAFALAAVVWNTTRPSVWIENQSSQQAIIFVTDKRRASRLVRHDMASWLGNWQTTQFLPTAAWDGPGHA
jgi:hypothetical protein